MRWWILILLGVLASPAGAESPLYWAIANNDALGVWNLTQPDAAPGTLAETGQEPPMLAVERGAAEVLQVLIWRGSALDGVDTQGRNLLFPAAALGRLDLFDRIAASGARVDQVDGQGLTLVHAAAVSPHTRMLRRLLASGAAVQSRSHLGITPLMEASRAGRAEEVRVLLRWGAVPEDQDYLGRSVLDYARTSGDGPTLEAVEAALSPWTISQGDTAPLP